MRHLFRTLDEVLRGQATNLHALKDGQIDISVRNLLPLLIQMAAFYGFCMGWYAILNHDDPQYMQIWASMLKVPLLFFLTLLVTLPSLYVFNALIGSRLNMQSLVNLLTAAMAVTLAVLASFGPIVAFFSLTTTNYAFIQLFNVGIFAIASILGLAFLFQTLRRLSITLEREPIIRPRTRRKPVRVPLTQAVAHNGDTEVAGNGAEKLEQVNGSGEYEVGALEPIAGALPQHQVKRVFLCWMVLFAFVGGQMSWVLRPFIGEPGTPFEWFRERHSNFLEAVWQALTSLF